MPVVEDGRIWRRTKKERIIKIRTTSASNRGADPRRQQGAGTPPVRRLQSADRESA